MSFVSWFSTSAGDPPCALLSPRDAARRSMFVDSEDSDAIGTEQPTVMKSHSTQERVHLMMRLERHRAIGYPVDGMSLRSGSAHAWSNSPRVSFACEDGVSVLFSGDVKSWGAAVPSVEERHDAFVAGDVDVESDATAASRLLSAYRRLSLSSEAEGSHGDDALTEALDVLANLVGSFAFTLHDRTSRRMLAARDGAGDENLFWGSDGTVLSFSNDADALYDCNPTAVPFPAGCLYLSETKSEMFWPDMKQGWTTEEACNDIPGACHTFVGERGRRMRTVPRINSRGVLCGAVIRVCSTNDLAGVSH